MCQPLGSVYVYMCLITRNMWMPTYEVMTTIPRQHADFLLLLKLCFLQNLLWLVFKKWLYLPVAVVLMLLLLLFLFLLSRIWKIFCFNVSLKFHLIYCYVWEIILLRKMSLKVKGFHFFWQHSLIVFFQSFLNVKNAKCWATEIPHLLKTNH